MLLVFLVVVNYFFPTYKINDNLRQCGIQCSLTEVECNVWKIMFTHRSCGRDTAGYCKHNIAFGSLDYILLEGVCE